MPICSISAFFSDRTLTVVLLLGFLVMVGLSVVAYFRAIRPRRGTTEWMARLDRRSFAAIEVQPLQGADVVWAALAAIAAVVLRFLYLFFWLDLHRREQVLQIMRAALRSFVMELLPCAAFAVAIYVLVRLLFDAPLPALLCGVLGGFTQNADTAPAALVTFALVFVWAWMCAPLDAPLFWRGLWLVPAAGAYALALLFCWRVAWLMPFFVGAYAVTQVRRWHGGNPERRGKKLLGSLLWMSGAALAWMLLLWLGYCMKTNRIEGGAFRLLTSSVFYRTLLPVLKAKIFTLFARGPFAGTVLLGDSFLFLLGAAAMIPLAHGIWKERDSRCLWIACLVPCFLCVWLIGGVYLMHIPCLLALAWVWSRECDRECTAYAIGSFLTTALCFGAEQLL